MRSVSKCFRAIHNVLPSRSITRTMSQSTTGVATASTYASPIKVRGEDYNVSLRVPFELRNDPIRGSGVFSASDVDAGQILFVEKEVREDAFTVEQFRERLSSLDTVQERQAILDHTWSRVDPKTGEVTVMWTRDTAALMNHSDNPNIVPVDGRPGGTVALLFAQFSRTSHLFVDDVTVFVHPRCHNEMGCKPRNFRW